MRVTVEYFGPAREAAGLGSETIDVPILPPLLLGEGDRGGEVLRDANQTSPPSPLSETERGSKTVQALVRQIALERGGRLATLLLNDGELSRSLVMAVNDRQVSTQEKTDLHDSDVVTIIPPVSGGS